MDPQESVFRSSLASLHSQLRIRQEELMILKSCERELHSNYNEFLHNERLCLEPSLSSHTWSGHWAEKFDGIRREGIHNPYQKITGKQFKKTFEEVERRVQEIQTEIDSIKNSITSLQAQLPD